MLCSADLTSNIIDDLSYLPHFRTEFTNGNTSREAIEFRHKIVEADVIIICTPEYIFSISNGLKNALEWCVSSTVFSNKEMGLITASASGKKSHEGLKLIMKTLQARFTDTTALVIQGVKSKVDKGEIKDPKLVGDLTTLVQELNLLPRPIE